ncbi:MAG TPA: PEP-CTERM sorting domain-containing protein [Fimbriimonas sp.]|nr:PEP-CTERM sorting domain-containing protein [Fimbriimonas sp.]
MIPLSIAAETTLTTSNMVAISGHVSTLAAIARPELNAFINKPANTVAELVTQIERDKAVADRFMRHFSMTKSEVIAYVRTLRKGVIQKSGYFTVYSVPENGIIKAHVSFFPKGTPAFVDAAGDPVLRLKCGNPFMRGPKSAYTTSSATIADPNSGFVEMTSIPATPDSVGDGELLSYMPGDPIPPEEMASIDLREVEPPTDTYVRPQGFNPAFGLGPLGGLLMFGPKGGSSTAVPEPGTVIAIAIGLGAILRRRKTVA